jgi:hypothetical protein
VKSEGRSRDEGLERMVKKRNEIRESGGRGKTGKDLNHRFLVLTSNLEHHNSNVKPCFPCLIIPTRHE